MAESEAASTAIEIANFFILLVLSYYFPVMFGYESGMVINRRVVVWQTADTHHLLLTFVLYRFQILLFQ